MARAREGALSPHREVARTMKSEGGALSSRGGWRRGEREGMVMRTRVWEWEWEGARHGRLIVRW